MRFSRAAPDEGRRESQSGLARRLYVVCPELSDVRVRIASVGERFGRFLVEQVQTHKRRRANKQSQEATWQGRHDKGVKARRGSG